MADITDDSNDSVISSALKKRSVVFETVKSTFLGLGISVVSATAADTIYNSWVAKRLRPPIIQNISQLLNCKMTGAFIALFAAVGCYNAMDHNRTAKSFSERLAKQKADIKSTSIQKL